MIKKYNLLGLGKATFSKMGKFNTSVLSGVTY